MAEVVVTTAQPPIVIKLKGKKKKRKYTEGLESIESSEVALTRAANRLADAVSQGIRDYRVSRDRSSRNKRDGMLVDYVPNVGRGISEGIRRGSRIPYDVARAINHREFRNALKFVAKTMNTFKFPGS